jgi:hypothetical protein
MVSSPSDLKIVAGDFHDIRDLRDLYDPHALHDLVCFFFEGPLPHDYMSRAQALEASMHTSATASRSATILGLFIVVSSTVLISLTLS